MGCPGCARLKFCRRDQETLTFITRPGGASAGCSLCLARSSWSPTPAGLGALPTELQPPGTFQADLGRVSAPPSWCPAPSRPRSGRTASFDLRFPRSSAAGLRVRRAHGWALDRTPNSPTPSSPVTSNSLRVPQEMSKPASGAGLGLGLGDCRFRPPAQAPTGTRGRPTPPRRAVQRRPLQSAPRPRQMFIMKTREASQLGDPQGLSAEYVFSPGQ